MSFSDGYPNAGTQALYGGLFLLLLLFMGQLTLVLSPVILILTWVPLIAIFLWPTGADEALSITFVFILGILFDLINGERLGQTAILFLVYFVAINPKSRPRKRTFMMSWGLFAISILSVTIVMSIIAGFQLGKIFNSSLLVSGISAVCVFPVLYGAWWYSRNVLSGMDIFT